MIAQKSPAPAVPRLPDSIGRKPVGLLAGSGRYPICFAEKAKSLGIPVACVGIRHEADPCLIDLVESFAWSGLGHLGRTIRCFKTAGVERLVMAGKIEKTVIFSPWGIWSLLPDWRALKFWYLRRRADNCDDTLLLGLIEEFAGEGLHFDSALNLCPELLVETGVLTRRVPSAGEERDIDFGWKLAKAMGGLDVGQSVAVRDRTVLAVEAIEGTSRAIERAGGLCRRGGFVVVKVAKPQQDMRFDVPTVGCQTIETMHAAGARVLAIEAKKTIVLDQAATVALADHYGISLVARAS